MKWKNVYIFISSTFNDMHAERDYLIKRVFPELRLWCSERKLKLIDVDLRWGVSEKDATENKRVVDVCLNNLDKCRPFFLCLLGQRRGWIPGLSDINEETLKQFPGLSAYLGKHSITELEIIHALLHPLNESGSDMGHAFFFCRKPDYLENITSPAVRKIFQREVSAADEQLDELQLFRESLKEHYNLVDYDASWNNEKKSFELKNVHGEDLSEGRLENFVVGDTSLSLYILNKLKEAIKEEFPDHFLEETAKDDLQMELVHQDTFLFHACDSYIPRPVEETKILKYFQSESRKPYILSAKAGAGKTSMLAHLIQSEQIPGKVFYRFVGTSSRSAEIDSTLYMLLAEMSRSGLISMEEVDKKKDDLLLEFPSFLEKAAKEPISIVLDAVDQWNHLNAALFSWLPEILPPNVKLLLSIKNDNNEMVLEALEKKGHSFYPLAHMTGKDEKRQLIQGYLSQFLKDIDENQMDHILSLTGSDNPLYLKVVLNELRMHGSFDTLMEQLNKDYGATPKEAFEMVLERLEQEEFSDIVDSTHLTKYFLGTMAYALEGINMNVFPWVFLKHLSYDKQNLSQEHVMDTIYGLARHLSPYLIIDGNKVNFLYDSFRQAVRERYDSSYEEFHHLLAQIYLDECKKNDKLKFYKSRVSALTCLIYHGLEASENWTRYLFYNPWFVHALLVKSSAQKTAFWFKKAYEKGYGGQDYLIIADFIKSISARLDIGPNTLFYEMNGNVADRCQTAKVLCEQAEKEMNLPYYYPVYEQSRKGITPSGEITVFKEDNITYHEPYISGDHVIYLASGSSLIAIQDMETGEIVRKVKLKGSVDRSFAKGNYLYVWYYGNDSNDNGAIETFSLPSFESVFYKQGQPKLPEGFAWRWIFVGIDGIHYQYAAKEEGEGEILLYNLNTGEVVVHSVYPVDLKSDNGKQAVEVNFCDEYMMEYAYSHDLRRIWHIPTGALVHEKHEDYFCWCAYEKNKMWFLARKDFNTLICYVYERTEHAISLIQTKELSYRGIGDIKRIGICDERLCLFFASGIVWIYDKELEFAGSQKLNAPITYTMLPGSSRYYHEYLFSHKNRLGVYTKAQLLFFRKSEFFNNLVKDYLVDSNIQEYQPVNYEKNLILLSNESHKLNLNRLYIEKTQQHPYFTYDTDNVYYIGSKAYSLGVIQKRDKFYIQMTALDSLDVGLRFGKDWPEGTARIAAAFYKDGKIGVAFERRGDFTRKMHCGFGKVEEVMCTRYIVHYYDIFHNLQESDVWEPEVYQKYEKPIIVTANDTLYFILLCSNIDEDHSEIQIYDPFKKELLFSHRYKLQRYRVKGIRDTFVIKGKIYIAMSIVDEYQMLFLEIDLKTGDVKEHYFELADIKGCNEKEVFCYSSLFNELKIYSLETDEMIGKIITRTAGFCYKILRKNHDILVCYSGGIVEVYDGDTFEYKYRQMLRASYEYIKDIPGTDYLYLSVDKGEFYIYKSTSHFK